MLISCPHRADSISVNIVQDKAALRACFAIDAISSADCKDADYTIVDRVDIAATSAQCVDIVI